MDPALLKAIQKGGGKSPSKVKGKAKKKAPARRPDQKKPERNNAPTGRVVGKNYKPKASSGGSAASGPPRPPVSSGQNNALLGNILAARENMKKKGKHNRNVSGGSKTTKVTKPSKPSPIKSAPPSGSKWGGSKKSKSPNASPKPSPKQPPKVPSKPSPDSSPIGGPKKKWGFNKKNKSPKPSPQNSPVSTPEPKNPKNVPPRNPYQSTIHKPTTSKSKAPSIMPSTTSPTASPGSSPSSSEVKRYKERIAALEKENKTMSQKLSASEGKEKKLMETIVRQQNEYNALQKEHKMLKQQFEALRVKQAKDGGDAPKMAPKNVNGTDPNLSVAEDNGDDDTKSKHKKKGSKWSLFGSKKSKENLVKDLEAEPGSGGAKETVDDAKTMPPVPKQPVKSVAPPKASGIRKKPMIPKDNVVPKMPPRPSGGGKTAAPSSQSKSGNGGNDAWSAYLAKHHKPPASASQLQNFSKSTAGVATLNFKQAREMYNANQ